ncbi:MAG: carboxyl transferase domain-containing protein, partial [Clostridia bacterium]
MDKILSLKEKTSELKSTSSKVRALINSIIDEKSFVEIGALTFSSNTTFSDSKVDGEGVVTGYGAIDGIPVYVYAENFEALQGGFGKTQADKIVNLLDMAEKTGTPVVSILDSAGARLGEGLTLLEGYAKVMKKSADLAGIVPQIAIVNGKAFGGISYLTAMSDLTFMVENSQLATCGPMVLQAKEGTTESYDSLIGAKTHAAKSGLNAMTLKAEEIRPTLAKVLDLILCDGEVG